MTSAYEPATGRISVKVPSITNAAPGHYYAIALDGHGVQLAKIVQLVAGGGAAAVEAAVEAAPATVDPNVPRQVAVVEPREED